MVKIRRAISIFLLMAVCITASAGPCLAFGWNGQNAAMIRQLWDAQTLDELAAGQVTVPDAIINESLTAQLKDNPKIKSAVWTTQSDNKIMLLLDMEQVGRVQLKGSLEELRHDKDHSLLRVRITDKRLLDDPILSFLFSRVSLAMMVKLFGNVPAGDGMNVQIEGNKVTVDFHDFLYASPVGQAEVFGMHVPDLVTVSGVSTEPGALHLAVDLNGTPAVNMALQQIRGL